jgi:hypothetical protein
MVRLLWLVVLVTACGDTGGERVSVALFASGTPAREVAIGDTRVVLTRAELAFGPAYFCASATASAELCAVALAELREPTRVSALDPSAQAVGVLAATTGTVHSAIYDLGISWLLTQSDAHASAVAPEGHSALLEGILTKAGRTLRFRAGIDASPARRGELAVNTQRTEHELTGEGDQLTLVIDANTWVDRLDVDALFALDTDGDGSVVIEKGTTSYDGILMGMVSRAPLGLRWGRSAP